MARHPAAVGAGAVWRRGALFGRREQPSAVGADPRHAVRGVPRHDVSNNPRIKGQMDKFIAAGRPSSRKNSLWLSMHDSAVSLGEEKFKFDLVGLLIKL